MEYIKTRGHSNMAGELFEVKMAALLFLRLKNNSSVAKFRMATNVDEAGALDDIVVKYTTHEDPAAWRTAFIQLKHKRQKGISVSVFNRIGRKADHFALPKYLRSFKTIKEKMRNDENDESSLFCGSFDLCEFALYTNSKLMGELETRKQKQPSDKFGNTVDLKVLLESKSENGNVFKFQEDEDKDIFSYLVENEGPESEVREFLAKFTVFSGQPSEKELDDVIKKEMPKLFETDQVYRIYEKLVEEWWNDWVELTDTSDIVKRTKELYQFEKDLSNQLSDCTLGMIDFKDTIWEKFPFKLSSDKRLCHVNNQSGFVKITATKILRYLQRENIAYTLTSLQYILGCASSVSELFRSWQYGKKECLCIVSKISDFDDRKLKKGLEKLLRVIFKVLKENSSKRVVFVSGQEFLLALENILKEKEKIKDIMFITLDDKCKIEIKNLISILNKIIKRSKNIPFEFEELDQTSRELYFARELCFQNNPISLNAMLHDDAGLLTQLWSESFIETLLSDDLITIGSKLQDEIPHYITRQLRVTRFLTSDLSRMKGSQEVIALTGENIDTLLLIVSKNASMRRFSDSDPKHSLFVVMDEREAEEQFEKLCKAWKNVCWFHIEQDEMDLVRFQGDITNISTVLTEKEKHAETNVVINCRSKAVIIIGEPGMGKSTLLPHLGRIANNANPTYWIIQINLREHCELLNISAQISAEELLTKLAGIVSPLDKTLFQVSLERTGDMMVFLDGFDEICPRYLLECCELLTKLVQSRVKKVVVTSRSSMKTTLESHLATKALEIVKFSEQDQISFFRKFWRDLTMSDEQKEDFIASLMTLLNAINGREKQFMGIPLQTAMVAEIFNENALDPVNKKLPETLDHINLLEQFIEKKFEIYFRKSGTNSDRNQERETFLEQHMRAAVVSLISREGVLELESMTNTQILKKNEKFLDKIEVGQENAGIIVSIIDRRPVFIHNTFAVYFASLWFSKNYKLCSEFLKNRWCVENFEPIRSMFDYILAKDRDLHTAVLNNDAALVEGLLLRGSPVGEKAVDKGGRTALHLATSHGFEYIKIPYDSRFIGPRTRHMTELLLEFGAKADLTDDVMECTPLEYAIKSRAWDAIEYILPHCTPDSLKMFALSGDVLKDDAILQIIIENGFLNFLKLLLDRGLESNHTLAPKYTLLHGVCMYGDTRLVNLLLEKGAHKSKQNSKGETPLHIASNYGHVATISALLRRRHNISILEILISPQQLIFLKTFVDIRNKSGRSALHQASIFGFVEVVRILIENGGKIQDVDKSGRNCLHWAASCGHMEVVRVLIETLGDDSDATIALIDSTDLQGKTACDLAIAANWSELVNSQLKRERMNVAKWLMGVRGSYVLGSELSLH